MTSHLLLMAMFSVCVSSVFAGLLREEPQQQLLIGAKMFGAMVIAAIILGWLMYPFPL